MSFRLYPQQVETIFGRKEEKEEDENIFPYLALVISCCCPTRAPHLPFTCFTSRPQSWWHAVCIGNYDPLAPSGLCSKRRTQCYPVDLSCCTPAQCIPNHRWTIIGKRMFTVVLENATRHNSAAAGLSLRNKTQQSLIDNRLHE